MIKRGYVYLADIPKISGSIQYGKRPVLVISNNVCNDHSSVITVVPLTTQAKKSLPTHTYFIADYNGKSNIILGEQILTIEKDCIEPNTTNYPYKLPDFIFNLAMTRIINVQIGDYDGNKRF